MFRNHFCQALVVFAFCSSLATATLLVRAARAAPDDVVDLEGDTHHNPPASTTDKSTPLPAAPAESEPELTNEAQESRDATKQEAAKAKLKLRAGERVDDNPRGAAQALGMSLQEGTHNRVKIVEVAMNSPAFDAGVMKGDEIVYFQGFRGETYRKWIDGIRRLTGDTAPGLKIPVVVARDGKQLTVAIEVPEKPVRPSIPRPLAQTGSPLIPPGIGPALPTTGGTTGGPAAVSGGNNVVIDNGGPFGEFFHAASANERAIAYLVRIGGPTQPNSSSAATREAAQNLPAGTTVAPKKGGARIGLAGFRDEPSGMVVMVDVGALPPGNYTVGIADPSVIGGATVTGTGAANPNVQAPTQLAPPQAPASAPGEGGKAVPNSAVPPTGTRQPQGNLPPASNRFIPRAILAQVAPSEGTSAAPGASTATDTIPPTGEVRPSTIPATGEVNPSSTPATGEVNPSSTPPTGEVNPSTSTPTGQSSVNNAQRAQMAKEAARTGQSGAGVGMLNQIGTITVDQSGTGRMQQKVETLQVRNIVGQAIVLYSQGGPPEKTIPANLNGGAGAATRQGVVDSAAGGSQRANDANGGQGSAAAQTVALQPPALQSPTAGSQVPVAGGIIQLVTDRRPPPAAGPPTTQSPGRTSGAVEQPASATPPTRQNIVR